MENVNKIVEDIIETIENELDNAPRSNIYLCDDGTEIHTDVGYILEWFDQYKEVIRKKYCNKMEEN